MKDNAQLINQDSNDTERYTDPAIMERVRKFFGEIELDPASSRIANKVVQAKRIITKKGDGLSKPWKAKTVWLNHPFQKGEKKCHPINCKKKACNDPTSVKYRGHCITEDIPSNLEWMEKLISEYEKGNFEESLNITFVNSSETWCQLLLKRGVQCFIDKRIEYYSPTGKKSGGVTKGSMITYIGKRENEFAELFSEIGEVKFSYKPKGTLVKESR
jgi:ParB family chromosome partitioning protein